MPITTFSVPMMYGDHHVVAVRRLLLAQSGVLDVYASASFQTVEIEYDAAEITVEALRETLAAVGYLGDLALPVETGAAAADPESAPAFFRQSTTLTPAGPTVTFTQTVSAAGRALWPCPGVHIQTSDQ